MEGLKKDALFSLAEQYVEHTSVSVFLTGKAGTGKTTFLRYIVDKTAKRSIVLAPTGVAAVNAQGSTIHSFFSLPLCPYLPDVPELKTEYQLPEQQRRLRKDKIKIIRTLDLLIIDEISMVRADLLDAVDMMLRRYRRSSKPFGGIQLLMIGDAQQLSPVVTEAERPYIEKVYPSAYFFYSKALQQLPYLTIELQAIYRQADKEFIGLLNGVRNARLTPDMFRRLNSRVHAPAGDDWIRLTTHNAQADNINFSRIEALPGEQQTFQAQIDGDFPSTLYPAAEQLSLKEGARVMFIRNDRDGRFYNGKLGTVAAMEKDLITVVADDGDTIPVERTIWENLQYSLDDPSGEITQEVKGSFTQFPLRLAWAITIHKSQGLTFDHVIIDAGAAFAFGQVYVALSRCRSLEGISLSRPINGSLLFDDADVAAFNASFPQPAAVKSALEGYRQAYELEQRCSCFDFSDLRRLVFSLRKVWRESLATTYPTQLEKLVAAANEVAECEQVAEKFRHQLMAIQGAADRTSERVSKAVVYFLPRLEGLGFQTLLAVQIDNAQVRKQVKNIAGELLPLWNAHLETLRSVADDGFDSDRYRQIRSKALIEEESASASKKKVKATPVEVEVRDVYNDNRHPELIPILSAWRRKKAEEAGVPAFHILHQRTLLGIADAMPLSRATLLAVYGFGPGLWEKFGLEIINLLSEQVSERP